jgi:hypothetical protein
MAAPTAPTQNSIVVEALKKAGYSDPATNNASLVTRAKDEWMQEIKNDIWAIAKKLKSLQTISHSVTVKGQSRYTMPTDFSSPISMTLLDGSKTGTAQAFGNTSITLAAAETATLEYMQGKFIIALGDTGSVNGRQVTAYNTTTKVATIGPSWDLSAESTVTYIIIENNYALSEEPVWNLDIQQFPGTLDKPVNWMPVGDSDYTEFYLYQTPNKVYAIQHRYYANLMTIDLSGTLMATLYSRWRNIFTQGVLAKALKNDHDDEADRESAKYTNALQGLILREQYGMDLSNLQQRVGG